MKLVLLIICGFWMAASALELTIHKDYYTTSVSFGEPTQTMDLALDLTTQILAAYAGPCSEVTDFCIDTSQDYFRTSISQSFNGTSNKTLQLYYTGQQTRIQGDVIGFLGYDALGFGSLSIGSDNFYSITNVSSSIYNSLNASGILGLGPYDSTGYNNFYRSLLVGWERKFTLYTNHTAQTAVITLNDNDTEHCVKNWFPVNVTTNSTMWEVDLDGYAYGPNYEYYAGPTAVISSLYSGIAAPAYVLEEIRTIGGRIAYDSHHNHHIVDCSIVNELPDLSLRFNGYDFNISSSIYVQRTPSNYCVLRILENDGSHQWTLGYTFLRSFCVEFNDDLKQVSFAAAVNYY